MTASGPAGVFQARLSVLRERFDALASMIAPDGLTQPDEPSGEQWEWGQVWAHLAEFIPYWVEQIGRVVAADGAEPVPFGRTKTDPGRIAAIERDRAQPVQELWARLRSQMAQFGDLLDALPTQAWERRGEHSTLGVMEMPKIVEVFVVGHLEQHADQLDGLAEARLG